MDYSSYHHLLVDRLENGVLLITMNRPEVYNAADEEMHGQLARIWADVARDESAKVAVITGAGKAFSAGGDVNWFKKGVDEEGFDLPADVRRGAEVLHQGIIDLRRIPYPVIAAVNGPAAGAGFSLALACDIRIAADSAFFAPAYGRIGASPDGGMTYFLPRVVGPSRALEILLTDPNMPAEEAKAEGLVTEVVPADQLLEKARELADKLAQKAPHYVRMAKLLTGVSIENSIADHLQLERHGIADSMATEDLRAGVTAFFGGEKPKFEGR